MSRTVHVIEPLTFSYMRHADAVETAMHALGYTEYRMRAPSTHSLETRVLIATLLAYDDMMASGYFTRGMVPKPKTNKDRAMQSAVFSALLDLAQTILSPNTNRSREMIHDAWKAATT